MLCQPKAGVDINHNLKLVHNHIEDHVNETSSRDLYQVLHRVTQTDHPIAKTSKDNRIKQQGHLVIPFHIIYKLFHLWVHIIINTVLKWILI